MLFAYVVFFACFVVRDLCRSGCRQSYYLIPHPYFFSLPTILCLTQVTPKFLKLNNVQQPPKTFLYIIGEHFKVPQPDAQVNIDVTIAIEFDSRFICYYTEKTVILSDPLPYNYFPPSNIFPY